MQLPAKFTTAKNTKVDTEKKTPKKTNKTLVRLLIILGAIILGLSLLFLFFLYLPGKKLMANVNQTKVLATNLRSAISDKDLNQSKEILGQIHTQVDEIGNKLNHMAYLKVLPVANNYYHDAKNVVQIGKDSLDTGDILIKAVEPYQDFLGLKGSGTSSAETTEDRITFLTQSIEGLIPHFDLINEKLNQISKLVGEIDIQRYPETYQGIALHQSYNQLQDGLSEIKKYLYEGRPLLNKTSWLLGKDKARNYLIIFQNDGELRPSGGFWTAYATITMKDGKVTPGTASNIYDLDDRLSSTTPAPRILKSYQLKPSYLFLRDSNLSPDFPTDAKIFLEQYYKAMGNKNKFDAVIAIDTKVLVDVVKVLGKLDTRVGTFTADPDPRCDGCPKVIYDLQWIAGRPRNYIEADRKGFLGPVMQSLLANAMGSGKEKMPGLAQAFFDNVYQKHILFYFTDEDLQQAAIATNIAGQITQSDAKTDYFHLNDASFDSAKSNIFVTQKIKHELDSKNGQVKHKFTITYTNPTKASNCNLERTSGLCLNASAYRNLFRFYVPIGSDLTKMTGSEIEPIKYEELGKQVFEGFYGNKYPLYAESSNKVTIEYTSSVKPDKNYILLLQKQPGTKLVDYELTVNGQKYQDFSWSGDKTIRLSL